MTSIKFKKLKLPKGSGPIIFNIYYVVENGRSPVNDNFSGLPNDTKDLIKALIINMAVIKDFKSPKIKYNLKGYNYGEIRPMPHRFFFFQKCGNNYIFFEYKLKTSASLGDKVYREINQKKERYENEFKKFIQGN